PRHVHHARPLSRGIVEPLRDGVAPQRSALNFDDDPTALRVKREKIEQARIQTHLPRNDCEAGLQEGGITLDPLFEALLQIERRRCETTRSVRADLPEADAIHANASRRSLGRTVQKPAGEGQGVASAASAPTVATPPPAPLGAEPSCGTGNAQ